MASSTSTGAATEPHASLNYDGQVVLVFEGGGALGAYQVGVYQALHEAGIEPDWIVGTSIGAINAAIIAGNVRSQRLDRLKDFWEKVQQPTDWGYSFIPGNQTLASLATITAVWSREPAAALNNTVAISPFQEFYFGSTPKPRLTVGIGFNWNSPFGPFRIDFAKTLLKQAGDNTKSFSFNVGTQF